MEQKDEEEDEGEEVKGGGRREEKIDLVLGLTRGELLVSMVRL